MRTDADTTLLGAGISRRSGQVLQTVQADLAMAKGTDDCRVPRLQLHSPCGAADAAWRVEREDGLQYSRRISPWRLSERVTRFVQDIVFFRVFDLMFCLIPFFACRAQRDDGA